MKHSRGMKKTDIDFVFDVLIQVVCAIKMAKTQQLRDEAVK